jgi:hypothetical protein
MALALWVWNMHGRLNPSGAWHLSLVLCVPCGADSKVSCAGPSRTLVLYIYSCRMACSSSSRFVASRPMGGGVGGNARVFAPTLVAIASLQGPTSQITDTRKSSTRSPQRLLRNLKCLSIFLGQGQVS